jgi:hypothetical protein
MREANDDKPTAGRTTEGIGLRVPVKNFLFSDPNNAGSKATGG